MTRATAAGRIARDSVRDAVWRVLYVNTSAVPIPSAMAARIHIKKDGIVIPPEIILLSTVRHSNSDNFVCCEFVCYIAACKHCLIAGAVF